MIRRRFLTPALAIGLVATAQAEALPPGPPATTVSASYMIGREWQVSLDITPPAKEIFVALGTGEFASTGFWTALTGEAIPKSLFNISDVSQTFRVRVLTREGKTEGPFTLDFDREKEVVRDFKDRIEGAKTEWLIFREFPKGKWLCLLEPLDQHLRHPRGALFNRFGCPGQGDAPPAVQPEGAVRGPAQHICHLRVVAAQARRGKGTDPVRRRDAIGSGNAPGGGA